MPLAPASSDPPDPFSDPVVLVKGIVEPLQGWFEQVGRDLPWRRSTSPWRTLVSEFMLQQTQVSRVEERFEGFLERFPTPVAMVEAGEDEVLAAWWALPDQLMEKFADGWLDDGATPDTRATLTPLTPHNT